MARQAREKFSDPNVGTGVRPGDKSGYEKVAKSVIPLPPPGAALGVKQGGKIDVEEVKSLYGDRKVSPGSIRKWISVECDEAVRLPRGGLRINGQLRTHGRFVMFNPANGLVRVSILDDITPHREYYPDEVHPDYEYERVLAKARDVVTEVDSVEVVTGKPIEDETEPEADQAETTEEDKMAKAIDEI